MDERPTTSVPNPYLRMLPVAVLVVAGALAGAFAGARVMQNAPANDLARYRVTLPWEGPRPRADDWPWPPRPGEHVRLAANGTVLEIDAPLATTARRLADALYGGYVSRHREFATHRAVFRARLAAYGFAGPLPEVPPAEACALLLDAWVLVEQGLAQGPGARRADDAGRAPGSADPDEIADHFSHSGVAPALEAVGAAALTADPATLYESLAWLGDAEAGALRTFAEARTARAHGELFDVWRSRIEDRTERFGAIAALLRSRYDAGAGDPGALGLQDVARTRDATLIEPLVPDPAAAIRAAPAGAAGEGPSAIAFVWVLAMGLGASAGGAIAWIVARSAARLLRALEEKPAAASAASQPRISVARAAPMLRAPGESLPWLNIVSGSSGRRVAQAASELCAHWIARGERVLLLDGGPRLRLHVPFEAEARLGLSECLEEGMPLLGLLQCAGVPGLYLLVHGPPGKLRNWAGLDRLLDDARPHFDRVLLALDLGCPYPVGRALSGRYYEAWWADPDPEQRAGALSLSQRLGIRFNGMELGDLSGTPLDVVRARIEALRPEGVDSPKPLPDGVLSRPEPEPAAGIKLPTVLDCDLQVRERLRFLMWARRLQGGSRSGAPFPFAGQPAAEPKPATSG